MVGGYMKCEGLKVLMEAIMQTWELGVHALVRLRCLVCGFEPPPPCPSLPPSGYRTGHYNVWHCWSFWTFYIFEALSLKSLKSRIETIWKQFVKPLEYVNGELLANNYKSCLKIIIIRSDQIHTWISEYTVYLFFFCFILSLQAKQWRTRTNYRPGLETKLGVPYFFSCTILRNFSIYGVWPFCSQPTVQWFLNFSYFGAPPPPPRSVASLWSIEV